MFYAILFLTGVAVALGVSIFGAINESEADGHLNEFFKNDEEV